MLLISNLNLPHDFCFSNENIIKYCAKYLEIEECTVKTAILHKRSVDARKKSDVHFCCSFLTELTLDEEKIVDNPKFKNVQLYSKKEYVFLSEKVVSAHRPVVVGFGPAGIFAALTLAKCGLCPVVLERGQDVDTRRRDVDALHNDGVLNENSNIQFGEGGAGTFSDGKLTTGIKDIRCRAVLNEFVKHGADCAILYDAKPHIGTDVLAGIVKNIRKEIISLGGEVHFGATLCDIKTLHGRVKAAIATVNGKEETFETDNIILATGHSARDTFEMLKAQQIEMQQKAFAIGSRIEHKQRLIDISQLGRFADCKEFTPTDYKLAVHLKNGRGVYTFCMCPGGSVINASSESGCVVTNGMSNSKRDGENANSALLVSVEPADFKSRDVLAGVYFQREIEQKAYKLGHGYCAPSQTLNDFMRGVYSGKPNDVKPTFKPRVTYCKLDDCLPKFVTDSMREAIPILETRLHGFANGNAILTAPETRSSSPVRIIRNDKYSSSLMGLTPCGEGAGYAGGIMSAAVDGIRCAESIIERIKEI